MEIGIAVVLLALVAIKVFQHHLPRFIYQGFIVVGLGLPLVITVYALWLLQTQGIGWRELVLFLVFYVLTGLGTTLGLHRLLTHRSFETVPAVRLFFLIMGSMANQGKAIDWAANHLKHHAYSDQDGDPHSPLHGFAHAHIGWILTSPPAERERYCKPLLNDPLVLFVDRTWMIWLGLGLLIPYLVAGWSGLLWGGVVRMTFGNHVVFAVNSICHTFGDQPFDTRDRSRNNWLIGLLALGEGWHNNHHAFPAMAFHGMGWKQFDFTAIVIRLLVRAHLAWNVKQPTPALIERRRARFEGAVSAVN